MLTAAWRRKAELRKKNPYCCSWSGGQPPGKQAVTWHGGERQRRSEEPTVPMTAQLGSGQHPKEKHRSKRKLFQADPAKPCGHTRVAAGILRGRVHCLLVGIRIPPCSVLWLTTSCPQPSACSTQLNSLFREQAMSYLFLGVGSILLCIYWTGSHYVAQADLQKSSCLSPQLLRFQESSALLKTFFVKKKKLCSQ